MAVPFGFSVGDFIAGINLIITSIKAVREGKGSSAQLQALTSELKSLRSGLGAIHELNLEQTAEKEYVAIRGAVAGCEICIEGFVRGVSKYQPWLKAGVDGWKASFRKIQWAFCNKKDVAEFRDQLARHSSAINMLMVSLQVRQGLAQKEIQKTCLATLRETFDTTVELQVTVSRSHDILKGLSEQQETLFQQMTRRIEQLENMLQLRHQLPPQVLLQKPVVLLDACGRAAPFHLDFIDSKELFLTVLKIRFKQCGVTPKGIGKIDRSEFILRDQRRDISLDAPWQTIFKPGQTATMSMVFRRFTRESTCPRCHSINEQKGCGETEW
ncbi:hypothetical protein MMC30_005034 [Trapelia coarctata]|nr:hypothetical protein [Trapelia coarctata]